MMAAERLPQPLGAAVSLAAGTSALGLVVNEPAQTRAVVILAGGLSLLLVGAVGYRKGRPVGGVTVGVAGGSLAIAAVGLAWSGVGSAVDLIELLPGMVGLLIIAGGVIPVRRGWERRLISVGSAGLLVSVLISGLVRDMPGLVLLAAAVATVVAWDAAEQAVSLGEQVGARATTWTAELTHMAGTIVVGAVAVGLALGTYRFGLDSIPLAGLILLAVGGIMLTVALYN